MFKTEIFKNVALESITFEANSAIIVVSTVSQSGNSTTKVLTFTECEGTKPLQIVKHVLKSMVAEFMVIDRFDTKFGTFDTGAKLSGGASEIINSNIRMNGKFKGFLSASVIYKSDSKGKLNKALVCDEGVTLRDTALNVKIDSLVTMFKYDSKQFRDALHHTACAILDQTKFVSMVNDETVAINAGLKKLAEKEAKEAQKKAQKPEAQKKAQKPEPQKKAQKPKAQKPEAQKPEAQKPEQLEKVA